MPRNKKCPLSSARANWYESRQPSFPELGIVTTYACATASPLLSASTDRRFSFSPNIAMKLTLNPHPLKNQNPKGAPPKNRSTHYSVGRPMTISSLQCWYPWVPRPSWWEGGSWVFSRSRLRGRKEPQEPTLKNREWGTQNRPRVLRPGHPPISRSCAPYVRASIYVLTEHQIDIYRLYI